MDVNCRWFLLKCSIKDGRIFVCRYICVYFAFRLENNLLHAIQGLKLEGSKLSKLSSKFLDLYPAGNRERMGKSWDIKCCSETNMFFMM